MCGCGLLVLQTILARLVAVEMGRALTGIGATETDLQAMQRTQTGCGHSLVQLLVAAQT